MNCKIAKIEDYVKVSHYIRAIKLLTGIQLYNDYRLNRKSFQEWKQAIVAELKANKWDKNPKVDLSKEYIYSNKYNFRQMFISTYLGQKIKHPISTQNIVYSIIALREITHIYDKVTREYLNYDI